MRRKVQADVHVNFDVFLLFFNALLSVALVAVIVVRILRREYLPVIRRLEAAESATSSEKAEAGSTRSSEDGE